MDIILLVVFCCTFLGVVGVTCMAAGVAAMVIGGNER